MDTSAATATKMNVSTASPTSIHVLEQVNGRVEKVGHSDIPRVWLRWRRKNKEPAFVTKNKNI